jgi:hypothetical protein
MGWVVKNVPLANNSFALAVPATAAIAFGTLAVAEGLPIPAWLTVGHLRGYLGNNGVFYRLTESHTCNTGFEP